MEKKLRPSGIDILGNVPWGTHFCQFYRTREDLLDILIPYFKAGLENNEFCMWVTSEPLTLETVKERMKSAAPAFETYLQKGQMELIPHTDWYLKDGFFDQQRVLSGWVDKLDRALKKGYEGLRLTGNTFWLEQKDWSDFTAYEEAVNDVIGAYRMLAVCTYSLDKCGANEVIDVVQNHQFAIIKREKKWEFIESSERKRAEEKTKHLASFPQLNPNPVMEVDFSGKVLFCNPATEKILESLGLAKGDARVFLPGDLDGILRGLEQKKESLYNREVIVKDRVFSESVFLAPQFDVARIYAYDTTERKRAEEELRHTLDELQRRQNEIFALFEASRAVLEYQQFKDSARHIFDSCKRLIGAAAGYVALLSADGTENEVLFLDSGGLSCSVDPALPMPIRGLREEAYRAGKVVYENDFSRSGWMKFMPKGHVTLEDVLFAPLVIEGKAVGLLGLGNKPGGFTGKDAELASAFSKLAAIALYNSRLLESLQRAKEEQELRVGERTAELNRTVESLQGEIRERLETESRIKVTNELLKLYTVKFTRQEYLDAAVDQIRTWSCCRHVGIRIADESGNIPYVAYAGFDDEFLASECTLSLAKDHCACTRVVLGKPAPQDLPAMTPKGSFSSNNSLQFLESLPDEQRSLFRGVCMKRGFKSLAVVPVRYRDKMLGAIHLAEEREGMVPLRNVELLEQMAFIIGEALFRFGVEDELRRNFDALKASSDLLENMFTSLHVMIAYMDRDFNFIRVNRAYAEADGKEPEFFVGKNHFALFPYGENERIFRMVVETGEPYFAFERAFEYAEHPERGVSYWDWSLVPVKEADGRVSGAVLSLINITERKKAEAERARLISAVESTAEAVVITDAKGIIRYINPAFEQITGYKKDEAAGRDLHILDSGKHGEAFYRELRETMRRDGVWRGRLINKKKDGTFYYEDCTFSPVRGPSGEIINYVSVKRDVTEKIRLESIAESVNTMDNIGYVFSGVRHEIGNPINTVKMILSVLQHKLDKADKESIRDYLNRALAEIGRVEDLLKSLKNFNMFETVELGNVSMRSFMEKFLKLVAEDFEKRGIAIAADIRRDAEWGYADPRALQQALLNIMTNAADALEGREKPAIGVTVMKTDGRIRIRIADNGIGMTEKQQQDIFKPFYTSKPRGTGLGLVIVKKMLTKMHGDIAITSRLNEGTTVDIFIPEGGNGS